MTTDDRIRDEKQQYNINREEVKILALSSHKIYKYRYLAGEKKITFTSKPNIRASLIFIMPSYKSILGTNKNGGR